MPRHLRIWDHHSKKPESRKKYACNIRTVVIGSILGSEDIINAMELRCFGVGKRIWLVELHMSLDDRWVTWACVLGFVALTTVNIAGIFSTQSLLYITHIQGIPDFLYR